MSDLLRYRLIQANRWMASTFLVHSISDDFLGCILKNPFKYVPKRGLALFLYLVFLQILKNAVLNGMASIFIVFINTFFRKKWCDWSQP